MGLLTSDGGQVRVTGTGWDLRRINNIGNSTLTLGSGLLVQGGFAEIGPGHIAGGTFWLTNYGTILGDFSGQAITIRPEVGWFVNYGLIAATNNGAVNITSPNWISPGTMIANSGSLGWSGLWTNSGTINLTNGSLWLGGSFTVAQLGVVNRSGGNVYLTGTLDLAPGPLADQVSYLRRSDAERDQDVIQIIAAGIHVHGNRIMVLERDPRDKKTTHYRPTDVVDRLPHRPQQQRTLEQRDVLSRSPHSTGATSVRAV